jgi:MFS family permease
MSHLFGVASGVSSIISGFIALSYGVRLRNDKLKKISWALIGIGVFTIGASLVGLMLDKS